MCNVCTVVFDHLGCVVALFEKNERTTASRKIRGESDIPSRACLHKMRERVRYSLLVRLFGYGEVYLHVRVWTRMRRELGPSVLVFGYGERALSSRSGFDMGRELLPHGNLAWIRGASAISACVFGQGEKDMTPCSCLDAGRELRPRLFLCIAEERYIPALSLLDKS